MFNFFLAGLGLVLTGASSDSERVIGGALLGVGLTRVLNQQPWANN